MYERFSSVPQSCPALCDPMDWTAAHQASLSITNSQSLLKLTSIESVMPSNHLILCRPLLPAAFNLSQHQGLFQCISSSHQVAKLLEFQLQFIRTDSLEKTLMLGKIEGRRRQGRTEDEMVGWHHRLNGH